MDHKDQLLLEDRRQEILLFISLYSTFSCAYSTNVTIEPTAKKCVICVSPILFLIIHDIYFLTAMHLYVMLIKVKYKFKKIRAVFKKKLGLKRDPHKLDLKNNDSFSFFDIVGLP